VALIADKTGQGEERARAALVRHNPQNRLVTPAEIGDTVAFLCRDSAASVTGQSLVIAGGEVM
jgi:2-hydroxycyclohexanecarboxyl-CoA dehydrogenase